MSAVLTRPSPARHGAERVQLVVGPGVEVLHRHLGAELDMLDDGRTKGRVSRQARLVQGRHIQLHEPGPLLLGDREAPVYLDQVIEPDLSGEPVRAAEGLRGERGQVINMVWLTRTEQRNQHRVSQDLSVEQLFQAMDARLTAATSNRLGIPNRLSADVFHPPT